MEDKYFVPIDAKQTDELSWQGKDGQVTIHIADSGDGKWRVVLYSKKTKRCYRRVTETVPTTKAE